MTSEMRLNIGCGQTPTRGWQNFDNSWSIWLAKHPYLANRLEKIGILEETNLSFIRFARQNSIEMLDVTKTMPFSNNVIDVIYSSHMLEHLDRAEALNFLREAQRVLRPNGVLRLAVPDIRKLVNRYVADGDADAFINSTLMCQSRPRTFVQRTKLLVFGQRHHHWMYDGQSLVRLLTSAGFVNTFVLPAGQTNISNPGELDLNERSSESVYVEGVKQL